MVDTTPPSRAVAVDHQGIGEAVTSVSLIKSAGGGIGAVKPYDFQRPDKFSKEQFRALRMLHDSFARLLASSLTSHLRSSVQIHCATVGEAIYGDYISTLPAPTVMYVVTLDQVLGQAVVELNLEVAQAIIDRLLGGTGLPSPRSRELSEIELGLLRTLGNFFVSSLRDAWAHVIPIHPTVNEPVFSPEFVQITLPSEATAKLVFNVSLFQTSGTLSLCIPHPVLQPVMDRLTARTWITGSDHAAVDDACVASVEQLSHVPVSLVAELGRARMSLREVMGLMPGQIVKLDTAADGDLLIRIGRAPKLAVRPGTVGKNLAVRVTNILA